jgi:hypothetical protein
VIYKNKNIIAKLKIQNGGLIQDGEENIFLSAILILWFGNIDLILIQY